MGKMGVRRYWLKFKLEHERRYSMYMATRLGAN